ncbi:hypothetical protein H6G91_27035 [Nostoc muscorum FACHB-395]|nr:hypothetical protein [Desmonostoc muscorum FACHB-395]
MKQRYFRKGDVYDGRRCSTVNLCYGFAIAFSKNTYWLGISTTGYTYAQVIQTDIHPSVAKPHLNRDLVTHCFRLK